MLLILFLWMGEEVLPVRLWEDQGLFVVSPVIPADIQQRVDFSLDLQPKAVDEDQLVRTITVIEGQNSSLIIQKESHPAWGK